MKKWKEIKDKPITWGAYAKLSAIACLISVPMSIWSAIAIGYPFGWEGLIDDIKDKFKK